MSIVNRRIYVFFFTFLALVIGSLASSNTPTDEWYQNLNKSDLNPPGFVFGIVWPILYLLMAITAYRTYNTIYKIYYIQLFLNSIWSWLFFSFQLPLVALFDILILIFINMIIFIKLLREFALSSILYLPYVLWLLFASYLNLFIVINN
tara:strand:+ start:148 stop:594 length:447 start_codon:yes stop_codon:yes gene_type:complete